MGVYPRREKIVDVSEREYSQLEAAPVDGTGEPDAADAPRSINVVSDEIEVATEKTSGVSSRKRVRCSSPRSR
jgi:hypothetical protein